MFSKIEDGEGVNKNGVGLGLTISNALVALLNGGLDSKGISVQSEHRKGSQFYFEILKNLKNEKSKHEKMDSALVANRDYTEPVTPIVFRNTNTYGEQIIEEDETVENIQAKDYDEFFAPLDLQSKLTTYMSIRRMNSPRSQKNKLDANIHSREVLLPVEDLRKDTTSSVDDMEESVNLMNSQKPNFNGYVLIVDDNPFNLLVAKNLFGDSGYKLKTALGGSEAIEIVKNDLSEGITFKAIFMDCQMPIMDGFEATKALKELMKENEIPEIPIFGWTANNSEEDIKRCYRAGMIGYLPKPATKLDISKALSKLQSNAN